MKEVIFKQEGSDAFVLYSFKDEVVHLQKGDQITKQYSRMLLTTELKSVKESWIQVK